jgi:peptidoglycan/xylan/chitin deacetylase (PgdA/CDA1 family)
MNGQVRVPILYYHQVAEGVSPKQGVSPLSFKAQIDYLQKNRYRTIGFEDLSNHFKTGHPLPPRPIIISFDDGYLNTFTCAYPILKKAGFKATTFVVSGFIGGETCWEGTGERVVPLMTREHILTMSADGFPFGGHTKTHKNLTSISLAEAKNEIESGKNDLEDLLQKPILSFAYPYGNFNDQIITLVKDCGFTAARIVHTDNTHRQEDLLKLRCVKINGLTPAWKFKYYLTGLYHLDILWQEWKKARRTHGK